jgi:hypothetical protein
MSLGAGINGAVAFKGRAEPGFGFTIEKTRINA